MVLPVGEHAASGGERRAGLGLAQGEHEAADARVRTRREQLGRLGPRRQRALQVLHQVPDGHSDVGAVAHHQSVDRQALQAVVGRTARRRATGGVSARRGVRPRRAVFIQHALEKVFEEIFEAQLHLEAR